MRSFNGDGEAEQRLTPTRPLEKIRAAPLAFDITRDIYMVSLVIS